MGYRPNPTVLIPGLQNASPEIRALADYITNELREVSRAFSESEVLESRTVYKEPTRPREGMIAVADGTNWNPGSGAGPYAYVGGTWVYLANIAGTVVTVNVVTVDFTSLFDASSFDIALVGATVGKKVIASVSTNMPADVDEDELEMDAITVAGHVTAADQVHLNVSSVTGDPIYGQRNINVVLL